LIISVAFAHAIIRYKHSDNSHNQFVISIEYAYFFPYGLSFFFIQKKRRRNWGQQVL